jgi:hypothetical protein
MLFILLIVCFFIILFLFYKKVKNDILIKAIRSMNYDDSRDNFRIDAMRNAFNNMGFIHKARKSKK